MNFHAPIKLRNGLSQYSILALMGLIAMAAIVIVANPFGASSGSGVPNVTASPGSTVISHTTSQSGSGSLLTGAQTTQSGSSGIGGTTGHHHHHDDGTNSTA